MIQSCCCTLWQDESEEGSSASSDYDLSSGDEDDDDELSAEDEESEQEDDEEWDPTMATPAHGARRTSSRQRSVRTEATCQGLGAYKVCNQLSMLSAPAANKPQCSNTSATYSLSYTIDPLSQGSFYFK